MQDSHDDFQGRLVHLLVLVNGNTASVVLYGDGVVFVDGYFNMGAVARHSFVDRVVDSFVDEVVQSFFANVANVHSRALAHCFQTLEHLNIARGIITYFVLFFCHCLIVGLNRMQNYTKKMTYTKEKCLFFIKK